MKKMYLAVILCFIFILTACNNNEELQPVPESIAAELSSFITEYRVELAEAFNHYDFAVVENYFIPNDTYYHFQRKTIQQNRSQRITEEVIDFTVNDVQQDQHSGYHLYVTEEIHRNDPHQGDSTEVYEITYIVMDYRGQLKVVEVRTHQ
ncbi:TcaA NTF2-like domain-containing protein [Anaerobacillus sp. MEB173]|uniref:TcaA NTF2-like domain-containing protein n=1 Tax=Anaerobacillus sp. MEB173 TaxID=3383345 RepID=UPI003F8E4A5B